MNFSKWDIVLVPFPFTDLSALKRRPALIISPNSYNSGGDLIIVFITSQTRLVPRLGDYEIKQWKDSGLPKPSRIRMKFATVHQSLIVKKIGQLVPHDADSFQNVLVGFFSS